MTFKNALELKQYLNKLNDNKLKKLDVLCTYSEDVEGGHVEVYVSKEMSQLQLIGSADLV